MNLFLSSLLLIALLAASAALLHHTQRRTAGLPRAPYGTDLEANSDIARVLHDIDARRSRGAGR